MLEVVIVYELLVVYVEFCFVEIELELLVVLVFECFLGVLEMYFLFDLEWLEDW